MAPRRRRHLPMTDEAFLDDPELVLIRPIPTAEAVGGGENFDVRVGDKVGHKVGLIIRSYLQSDGRRRSLTKKAHSSSDIRLRAKLISHVEKSLNHRTQIKGIPFVNTS